MAFALQLTI